VIPSRSSSGDFSTLACCSILLIHQDKKSFSVDHLKTSCKNASHQLSVKVLIDAKILSTDGSLLNHQVSANIKNSEKQSP
jgi:hypothetical protein